MPKISDIVPGYEWSEEDDLKMAPAWLQDAAHCIPPYTPMFSWFYIPMCQHGVQYAADKLSLPRNKSYEWRHFRGGAYLSELVVRDEEEIKRREVKFRENLRPYLEDFDEVWRGYREEMLAIYERLRQVDPDAASNIELKEHFEDIVNMYRRMYEVHWMMVDPVNTCYILFRDICSELLGIDESSEEFQALMKGFDNKAFQIDKRLWEFSHEAIKRGLRDIFETTEAKDVVSKLEQTESGREWLKEFRDFLMEDGWRSQRMAEINVPTWIEDPSAPIVNIQHFIKKGGSFDLEQKRAEAVKEREKIESALLQKIPEEQRGWFELLTRAAQKAGSFSEEHAHYLDLYSQALVRRCCLGIGRRFVELGAMDQVDDIFFLNGDEVRMAMITPEFHDLRPIVRKRRQDWEEWCKGINPQWLKIPGISEKEALQPFLDAQEPAHEIGGGTVQKPKPELKADLYGTGVSLGVAEGPARCISSYDQLIEVQPGEILVAPAVAASWTMIFAMVKGVITASGGSLSHAGIVGREYGIPVVTNVFDGIFKIKTGQRVRVDGNFGVVYFLK